MRVSLSEEVWQEGERLGRLAKRVEEEGYPRMAKVLKRLAGEVLEVAGAIAGAELLEEASKARRNGED